MNYPGLLDAGADASLRTRFSESAADKAAWLKNLSLTEPLYWHLHWLALQPYYMLFLGLGVYSIAGAVFNWNWFMNARQTAFMSAVIGRGPTRVFYFLLGMVLMFVANVWGFNLI